MARSIRIEYAGEIRRDYASELKDIITSASESH